MIIHNTTGSPIGCHDTPEALTLDFARLLLKHLPLSLRKKKSIRILDLFSGDGRLGRAIAEKMKELSKTVHVTFVEWEAFRNQCFSPPECSYEVVQNNAFTFTDRQKFDIVVSNPPYLALRESMATRLGFSWDKVKAGANNLYGLGIMKALELCREEGLVGIIAPFGWIRGVQGESFKNHLTKACSQIRIVASPSRQLFKEVTQDIGLQFFRKGRKGNRAKAKWSFRFKEGSAILLEQFPNKVPVIFEKPRKVAVGAIVWNRVKPHLAGTAQGNIPLIYGGNISHDGNMSLTNPKYQARQYLGKAGIRQEDLVITPVLLVRRTMRGKPGLWKPDSCILQEGFPFAIENHVISIELGPDASSFGAFQKQLMSKIEEYYKTSGSPSISVVAVRKLAMGLPQHEEIGTKIRKQG